MKDPLSINPVAMQSMSDALGKVHKRSFSELANLAFYRSDFSSVEAELSNIEEPQHRAAIKLRVIELKQGDAKIRLDALQKLNKYFMRHLTIEDRSERAPILSPEAKIAEICRLLAHSPDLLRAALQESDDDGHAEH